MPVAILRRLSTGSRSEPSAKAITKPSGNETPLSGGHSGSSFECSPESSFVKGDEYRAPSVAAKPTSRVPSRTQSMVRSLSRKLSLSQKPEKEPEFDETKQYYYQPAPHVDSANVVASKELDARFGEMVLEKQPTVAEDAVTEELLDSAGADTDESARGAEAELASQLLKFERLLGGQKRQDNPRDIRNAMNDSQTSLNTKLQALEDTIAADFKEFL